MMAATGANYRSHLYGLAKTTAKLTCALQSFKKENCRAMVKDRQQKAMWQLYFDFSKNCRTITGHIAAPTIFPW
jgi:hypothetical protein